MIKRVESSSVLGSVQIRRVTTGRASDYILMAAVLFFRPAGLFPAKGAAQ